METPSPRISFNKSIAMEKTAILNADLLDIVFEGRNKEYGAYELQRTYNQRMRVSISVMLGVMLLFAAAQWISSRNDNDAKIVVDGEFVLEPPPPPPDEHIYEPPPPPPPPPPPRHQDIAMAKLTPPKIVPDDQVDPEDIPPKNEDLVDVMIGTVNTPGDKYDGTVVAPPEADGERGIVETPKYVNPDSIVLHVQIESQYPGGIAAWQRFIRRTMVIPQDAIDNGIGGTVVVQFIVDKEGKVSDVKAISGPDELRDEAVRVIKKSGNWTPAIQNGMKVKSYKRQPIVIQVVQN